MKKRFFSMVGLVAVMSVSLALAASSVVAVIPPAYAGGGVVHDATGDTNPLTAPAYMDLVTAKVQEQEPKEALFFKMDLAGAIPTAPTEASLIWPFHVDTNPATTSFGTDPHNNYADYVVRVRWNGSAFVGEVVNRTTGVITPVPFSIEGTAVKVVVPLALLGNPSSFGWNASTRPSGAVPYTDFAPDGGLVTDLATWAQ